MYNVEQNNTMLIKIKRETREISRSCTNFEVRLRKVTILAALDSQSN